VDGVSYRYGFQSYEADNEVKGNGNSYTTEFRQYDPRLGRWLSLDPIVKEHESPYAAFANNPVWFVDPNGADTTFTDSQVAKDFNAAYKNVTDKVSALESDIKTIEGKLSSGELSKRETKKAKKELQYAKNDLGNWNKLKSDFESIITSPIEYIYTSDTKGLSDGENGLTNWNNKSYVEEDKETGNVTGGKIYTIIKPGHDEAVIHENRHGVQIAMGADTKQTFIVESEAYRYQLIYDRSGVVSQMELVYQRKYGHLDQNIRPVKSFDQKFDEMIKYLYNVK